MHPQIERLNHLFSDGKTNVNSFNQFFEELWLAGAFWNSIEIRSVVSRMLEWTKSQVPLNLIMLLWQHLPPVLFHFMKESLRIP